ncbi:SDR family oxidoreductase [Coleofasciculus chthonoplastes]|uniref:SDR family oxidoreductase n=1 Tax=Coleofasciculus chthonoplastes TaxID=64178 RepID=UPI0032F2F439
MAKTALITGGAIRVGRALAEACANHHYRLVIHYHHSADQAQRFSQELTEQGIEHCLLPCDLSQPRVVQQMFERIPAAFKPIDLLINSAARFPEQDQLQQFDQVWSSLMNINAYAPLSLIQQFAAQTNHTCEGLVVNIIDARLSRAQSEHFTYRLSKAVLKQATLDLAVSLAPKIRVNAIALGAILPPSEKGNDYLERLKQSIPLKQTGKLSQVQLALSYLIEQSFVTGDVLTLDGGEFL